MPWSHENRTHLGKKLEGGKKEKRKKKVKKKVRKWMS